MSLYRKYRPQTFSEIVGQEHVVGPLLKQLESGKINHAYLFSGPRGTGKTSTARIFAKALNCEKYKEETFGEPCNKCENCLAITDGRYLDVLEIDAASNRGIDEIRDLREKIRLAPTTGKFKVYIIDEVHMLTNEAFNALLKTLEEPPEHAVFILATTELHKVPATIQSRTQKFAFGLPSREKIQQKLSLISEMEGFKLSPTSLATIAKVSEAAYRDSEVLLEKVVAVNPEASEEEVEKILGFQNLNPEILRFLKNKETRNAVIWLQDRVESGTNPKFLTEYLIGLLRNLLMIKIGIEQKGISFNSPEHDNFALEFSKQLTSQQLSSWIEIFTNSLTELKDSPIPQLPLELALIEACEFNEGLVEPAPTQIKVEKIEETKVVKVEKNVDQVDTPTEEEVEVVEVQPKKEASELEVNLEKTQPKKEIKIRSADIQTLSEKWTDVLKLVKPKNNSVEIFLRSTTPISIEEDLITLEVGYRFHKDMLEEPKNHQILGDVFSEVLGRPVRIKVTVGEKKAKPKVESLDEAPIDEADPVEIFGKLV